MSKKPEIKIPDFAEQLTPEEDVKKYLAEKLARAKEMGFDTDNVYYHGSPNPDIKEFKPSEKGMFGSAVYLTKNPEEAGQYAIQSNTGTQGTPTIYPLLTKGRILNRTNYKDIWDLYKEIDPSLPNIDFSGNWWENKKNLEDFNSAVKKMDKLGLINDLVKKSKIFSGIQDQDHRIIFDPKNIRSKFAKFDPAMSESSDISSLTSSPSSLKNKLLNKAFKTADVVGMGSDVYEGNIADALVSAAEMAAPKLGAAASRFAPLLELLRPTEMEPEDDITSDFPGAHSRKFKKLKSLFEKK